MVLTTEQWERVQALVGDLADNMSSVDPNATVFLVDQEWAQALVGLVDDIGRPASERTCDLAPDCTAPYMSVHHCPSREDR